MENNPAYRHLDRDTVEALSVLMNMLRMWEEREQYMCVDEEKEEYDMCKAVRDWMAEERQAGLLEGKKIILQNMLHLGMQIEEICRMTGCTEEEVKEAQRTQKSQERQEVQGN